MLLMIFWRHHHCGRRKIKNNELYALYVRDLYEGGYGGRLLTPPVYCPRRYTTGGVEAEQAVVGVRARTPDARGGAARVLIQ